MMTLMPICLLLGAVLGQRFKVLVLVPGMAVVLPLVAAAGIVRAEPYGKIAITLMLAAVSLQLGYLAGISLRHLMVLLRGVSNKRVFSIPENARTPCSSLTQLRLRRDMGLFSHGVVDPTAVHPERLACRPASTINK